MADDNGIDIEENNKKWSNYFDNSSKDSKSFMSMEKNNEVEDNDDDDEYTKGFTNEEEPEINEEIEENKDVDIEDIAKKAIEDSNEEEEKEEEVEFDEDAEKIFKVIKEERSKGETEKSENSEEDEDDNVESESLKYRESEKRDFSLDDVNDYKEEEKEKGEEGNSSFSSEDKTDFDSLNNISRKREFKSGKLNKNYIFCAIGFVALLLLLLLGIQNKLKNRNKDIATNSEDSVSASDYNPDFGDYNSRRHTETDAERVQKDAKYVDNFLNSGKKESYSADSNSVQPTPVQQQQVTNSGVSDAWRNARDSSLILGGSGFGGRNKGNEGGLLNVGNLSEIQNGSLMNKQEYASSYLSNLGSMVGELPNSGMNNYEKANNGRYTQAGSYDRNKEGGNFTGIPDNSIYPGTVLQAILVSGINTDYPGTITARIITPVYDSKYGENLLIPQGSILRGSYSSSSIGIAKVQIAWESLIINRDGMDYIVNLGSMVGVDKKGYSGIKGSLNDHYFQFVRAAGLSAMFSMLNYNIYVYSNARNSKVQQDMISEAQSVGQTLTDRLLQRALDIQPTVIVHPGERVNVDVDKVLTLIPVKRDKVVEKYIRK